MKPLSSSSAVLSPPFSPPPSPCPFGAGARPTKIEPRTREQQVQGTDEQKGFHPPPQPCSKRRAILHRAGFLFPPTNAGAAFKKSLLGIVPSFVPFSNARSVGAATDPSSDFASRSSCCCNWRWAFLKDCVLAASARPARAEFPHPHNTAKNYPIKRKPWRDIRRTMIAPNPQARAKLAYLITPKRIVTERERESFFSLLKW